MVAAMKDPDPDVLTMTVSSKGQVVIPKAVRERLNLRAGDVLELAEDGDKLVLSVRRESPAALRERLFGPPLPIESLALRFADRIPPERRGLSMREMREIAQADFARRWREKEARNNEPDLDEDVDTDGAQR